MPDINSTLVQGVAAGGFRRGSTTSDRWDQYVVPVEDRIISGTGRAATFRTPGRATAGQSPLMVVWNNAAGGSGNFVEVSHFAVDLSQTVAKAVTVIPCIIRAHRISAAPTGGTVLTKTLEDTSGATASTLVVTGDASADGTLSGTALAATSAGVMGQEYSSRLITAVGYEVADQHKFLEQGTTILQPQQGVMIAVHAAVAGSNPATDMWLTHVRWREFIRP